MYNISNPNNGNTFNISERIKREINNSRQNKENSRLFFQETSYDKNNQTKISNDLAKTSLSTNYRDNTNSKKFADNSKINQYYYNNQEENDINYYENFDNEDSDEENHFYGNQQKISMHNRVPENNGLNNNNIRNNPHPSVLQENQKYFSNNVRDPQFKKSSYETFKNKNTLNTHEDSLQNNFSSNYYNYNETPRRLLKPKRHFKQSEYEKNPQNNLSRTDSPQNNQRYSRNSYQAHTPEKQITNSPHKIIKETYLEPIIKSEVIRDGETRIVNERELKNNYTPKKQENRYYHQEYETVRREKIIEVIKEKAVPVNKYVDVFYDVLVDVPIERTIEKEKITEVLIEKPFEKIVEIPIERIIEIPVEKIIEVPVYVKKYVERNTEKIVHRPYDVIKENIIMKENLIDIDEDDLNKYDLSKCEVLSLKIDYEQRDKIVDKPCYYDNIIEKEVKVPRYKNVEVPVEKIVKKNVQVFIDRPRPLEKIIHQEIEIPVEVPVYKHVQVLIEKPLYIENIIERRIPIERIVEVEIEVPIEHRIERPIYIDNIIQKKIERLVEVPVCYQQIIEVPVEEITENIVNVEAINLLGKEKVFKKSVPILIQKEIPFHFDVKNYVKKDIEIDVPKKVNRFFRNETEIIVEKEVLIERITEVPVIVEKIIEVPVEVIVENIIEKEIVIEKLINIDVIIEKRVEVIVEKIVEVRVEKIIEIPITIYIEKPIYKEIIINEDLMINTHCEEYYENDEIHYSDNNVNPTGLEREIQEKEDILEEEKNEYFYLKKEFDEVYEHLEIIKSNANSTLEKENIDLFIKLAQLQSLYQKEIILRDLLEKKEPFFIKDVEFHKDKDYDSLKNRIENLVEENHALCRQISKKGETILSQFN